MFLGIVNNVKALSVKLFFVCLLFAVTANAKKVDSICIDGQFKNNTTHAIVVLEKFGIGSYPIYKAEVNSKTGTFHISLPKTIERGIYRIRYSQLKTESYIDLIINGENVVNFYIDFYDIEMSPVFSVSNENKLWHQYKSHLKRLKYKILLLDELMKYYPEKQSTLISQVLDERAFLIDSTVQLRNDYISHNTGMISAKVEMCKPLMFFDPHSDYQLQTYNKWSSYWDKINTTDTSLLNTPLYTEHVIDYLRYWVDPVISFGEEEQIEGLKKSTDTLMKKFGANPIMKYFITEYLTLGFKDIGQEELLQYIDQHYRDPDQCTDESSRNNLLSRLDAYKKLATGKTAPKIYYTNASGVESEYFWNTSADTIIVAFWATWCPHCANALPKLDSILNKKNNIEAIAISLDNDSQEYTKAALRLKNFTHYCDYQMWSSKPVKDYNVIATPTFFMIDKDGFILGRYSSVTTLIQAL